MKSKVPRTFEEMLDAPDGGWHKLPGGFDVEEAFDLVEADTKRIIVALPKSVIRAFRPKPRERFSARVANGKLIIERAAAKQVKGRAKRSG